MTGYVGRWYLKRRAERRAVATSLLRHELSARARILTLIHKADVKARYAVEEESERYERMRARDVEGKVILSDEDDP